MLFNLRMSDSVEYRRIAQDGTVPKKEGVLLRKSDPGATGLLRSREGDEKQRERKHLPAIAAAINKGVSGWICVTLRNYYVYGSMRHAGRVWTEISAEMWWRTS